MIQVIVDQMPVPVLGNWQALRLRSDDPLEAPMVVETRWAIICPDHGVVYLQPWEYKAQRDQMQRDWYCPTCGYEPVKFDDDNFTERTQAALARKRRRYGDIENAVTNSLGSS